MKIKLAKRIGFCFGVKRAVNMAEAALKRKGPIYSLGSIIHNKQVVEALAKKGAKSFKKFSLRQAKVKDREFVLSKIRETLSL